MHWNSPAEGEEEGGQNQGQCDHTQENMADKDSKVDRLDQTVARIMTLAMQRVIHDVADQKQRREAEGGEHGCPVRRNSLCSNEGVADEQGRGAQSIEERIECRQERQFDTGRVCGRMDVDQPEEKKRGCDADSEDCCNCSSRAGRGGQRTSLGCSLGVHRSKSNSS